MTIATKKTPSWPLQATVLTVLLIIAASATGKPWWMRGVESNENDFLPPDLAFRVGARVDGNLIRVRWVIADGYYLYRQKFDVKAESPDLTVSRPTFPRGVVKNDPYLGVQETFRQQVEGTATYTRSDAGAHPLQIKVTYQGCADAGLCYPPLSKVLFPEIPPPAVKASGSPWEGVAILGGAVAFLVSGLLLRKGRTLALPVS